MTTDKPRVKKSRVETLETDTELGEQLITSINKTEILPFGTGMKLLSLDIPLTNEFLDVLTELCKIRQRDLKQYVTETSIL